MELLNLFVILVLVFNIYTCTIKGGLICPATCRCRSNSVGERMVICAVGSWPAFPSGFDDTINYRIVSGTPSNQSSITALGKHDFHSAPNLLSLEVSYANVKTIENGAFSPLGNLRSLVISNNDVLSLAADTFTGLQQLRTLDISGNVRCQFDDEIFKNIPTIETLNMGNMNLRTIKQTIFRPLTKLKVLKLYLNNIKRVQEDFIDGFLFLETLDLNGNLLRGIPAEWKPKVQTMKQVHLSENPLQCNCQLLWLRELPMKFYSSRMDTSNVVCNGPDKLKYASFVNVPEWDFVCIPPKVVKCEHNSYSTELNNRVVISCEYEGDPIPEIKWTRPDGLEIDGKETIQNQYEITENGTLVIKSITMADDGPWKVTAEDHMIIVVNVSLKGSHPLTKPTNDLSTEKQSTQTQNPSALATMFPRDDSASVQTTERKTEINWGLLIAAAVLGGLVVAIIFISGIWYVKKRVKIAGNRVGSI